MPPASKKEPPVMVGVTVSHTQPAVKRKGEGAHGRPEEGPA